MHCPEKDVQALKIIVSKKPKFENQLILYNLRVQSILLASLLLIPETVRDRLVII